jgi:hypothetical protein
MIIDDCEMLEARDLTNPKEAQSTLDNLMADSRPPLQRRTVMSAPGRKQPSVNR